MKTVNATKEDPNGDLRIILVRHAETPHNVDKYLPFKVDGTTFFSKGLVISGHDGVGLTDEGKRQCTAGGEQLARHLRRTGITSADQLMLLCSDLPRTRQTLDGFVAAMPGFGLDIEAAAFREELRGQAYDAVIDLQGLTKSALVSRLARVAEGGKRFALANRTEGSSYETPTRWAAWPPSA